MRKLSILCWHIHGSYLRAITQTQHNWYLPVKEGKPEGYGGRFPGLPEYVRDVPADEVRNLPLDLVIAQTPKNYSEDRAELLSAAQQRLPLIYLEHNTPKPHPTDSKHPVDNPNVLLVHVTYFNQLMWDNGTTPTTVIEHSVAIDPTVRYSGNRAEGITIINGMQRRSRIAGYDVFLHARQQVPITAVGMQTEAFGGLGDVPYPKLHRRIAEYRFLFSPMRYTSLPLAVIEGLTLGMPIVALATTELPTVIENGVHGYCSCNPDELIAHMRDLVTHPNEAHRLGANARALASHRFGLERFVRDWNNAFARVMS